MPALRRPPMLVLTMAVTCALSAGGCGLLTKSPRAEAIIVVDTDMPVPKLAGTLRADIFRIGDSSSAWNGLTWSESREFVLEDRLDWPASFGVTIDDDADRERFVVRLRLYPSGKTRSYRGERFLPPADASDGRPADLLLPPEPESGEPPRLMRAGGDLTPPQEPAPSIAIDRLVTFELRANERWMTAVHLRGDCTGVQADLAERRTCDAGVLGDIVDAPHDANVSLPARGSAPLGQWPVLAGPQIPVDCDAPDIEERRNKGGEKLFDEEACLPGGAFVFGDARWADRVPANDPATAGIGEERIAVVPRVFIDKYEFSVARAKRSPLAKTLFRNDDALDYSNPNGNVPATCTYGTSADRDALPLNCVSDEQAKALCESEGRELTAVVVYQYAFVNGYLDVPTAWPWSEPTPVDYCAGAVLGRVSEYYSCPREGIPTLDDPRERHASPADISVRGVHDLLGSLAEIQADSAQPFAARCWRTAPSLMPTCYAAGRSRWVLGSSWTRDDHIHDNPMQGKTVPESAAGWVGFRCMRRIDP